MSSRLGLRGETRDGGGGGGRGRGGVREAEEKRAERGG